MLHVLFAEGEAPRDKFSPTQMKLAEKKCERCVAASDAAAGHSVVCCGMRWLSVLLTISPSVAGDPPRSTVVGCTSFVFCHPENMRLTGGNRGRSVNQPKTPPGKRHSHFGVYTSLLPRASAVASTLCWLWWLASWLAPGICFIRFWSHLRLPEGAQMGPPLGPRGGPGGPLRIHAFH